MDRNQLRGKLGDELNVIFAAAGFNFRKIVTGVRPIFVFIFQIRISPIGKILFEKVWKRKIEKRKKLSSKDFPFSHQAFA